MSHANVAGTLLEILEQHFNGLGGSDIYRSSGAYIKPRLKRLTAGLGTRQLATLFGEALAHINYPTFRALFEQMGSLAHLSILETGSSAYGTNSSALFAKTVARLGGRFTTVDLNPAATANARHLFQALGCGMSCQADCADSVQFIAAATERYNVVYLDSYDLTPGHFVDSEQHGAAELAGLLNHGLLEPGALILVDDTPRSIEILATQVDDPYLLAARDHVLRHGRMPGKGAVIREWVAARGEFQILAWEYQLLLRYAPSVIGSSREPVTIEI